MVVKMYTIFDKVAQVHNRPYCMVSQGAAIRSFQDEINRADENNPLYKHPSDYDLYELGEFDDGTGNIIVNSNPVLVISGNSVHVGGVK